MRKGSGQDARFVRRLAAGWDVPCFVSRVNVPSHAAVQRLGLEEAARELRYRALLRMARRAGCSAIVTAHHAGDQAETVLMNFLRGAGPTGLAGIPSFREQAGWPLLRPFLSVTRGEILAYLKAHRLRYRQDPSNQSRRFTRNRIRRETLPYLERLNPGLSDRLVQAAEIFREEEEFWRPKVLRELAKTVRQNGKRVTVALPQLLGYHKSLSRRILRYVLPGLSFQEIERIFTLARLSQRTGRRQIAGGWLATRLADRLIIKRSA